jgi:hypothetical protein
MLMTFCALGSLCAHRHGGDTKIAIINFGFVSASSDAGCADDASSKKGYKIKIP